jgi:hypothetical protein
MHALIVRKLPAGELLAVLMVAQVLGVVDLDTSWIALPVLVGGGRPCPPARVTRPLRSAVGSTLR